MLDADIGVIGVGTMGSMAMWQLAKQGVSVLGFEQYGVGHDRSAGAGETRIFRTAYKEGSEYVPLLQEARSLWRELEKATNHQLLTMNNGLMIGEQNSEIINSVMKSIKAYDLEHEILEHQEAKKRYPQHKLLQDEMMILDKAAGFLRPEFSIISAANLAKDLGATILTHTRVEKIQPQKDHVEIHANDEVYKVGKVLITTGPWINELVPELKSYLKVRRLLQTWFAPKTPKLFEIDRFPVFVRRSKGAAFYGFPSVEGTTVKITTSSTEDDEIDHPSKLNKNVGVEEVATMREIVEEYLPELYPDPVRVNAFMEGYTNDNQSLVGEIPNDNKVVLCTGFSGHGFKLAPVMGRIATDILLKGGTALPVENLSPTRYLEAAY